MDVEYEPADLAFTNDRVATAINGAISSDSVASASAALVSIRPDAGAYRGDLAADASVTNDDDQARPSGAYWVLQETIASLVRMSLADAHWKNSEDRRRYQLVDMSPQDFVATLQAEVSNASAEIQAAVNYYCDVLRHQTWFESDSAFFAAVTFQYTKSCDRPDAEFLFRRVASALDEASRCDLSLSACGSATLFVVDCEADAEILRHVGFAGVSGEALLSIGKADVQQLFGETAPARHWRYRLVLLDLNFVSLEPGSHVISEILLHLADFGAAYDVDLAERFALYRPSAQDVVQLKRAVKFSDSNLIARLFENWAEKAERLELQSIIACAAPKEPDFPTARDSLNAAIRSHDRLSQRILIEDALRVYRSVVSKRITAKFYRCAEVTEDPFDQMFLTAAADFANTFLENDVIVKAAQAVLAGNGISSINEFDANAFEIRIRCLAQIRQIHKSCGAIRRDR